MLSNRFKNYGLWVSIAALVPLVMSAFGFEFFDEQKYTEIINAILAILVGMGLINNPTTKNSGFGDDKPEELESVTVDVKLTNELEDESKEI